MLNMGTSRYRYGYGAKQALSIAQPVLARPEYLDGAAQADRASSARIAGQD
jgi:hypothetical protein